MSHPKQILILGAGVTALQTVLTLLRSQPDSGYAITLVAQFLPGDDQNLTEADGHGDGEGEEEAVRSVGSVRGGYASPWAGAHWRTHAAAEDKEVCGWDAETYGEWSGMSGEEKGRAGVKMYTSLHYWDARTPEIQHGASSLWWSALVSDFTVLPPEQLPLGVHLGVSFSSFAVNVPQYLQYLLTTIKALGAKTVRGRLPSDHGFAASLAVAREVAGLDKSEVFAYVNATGIGAGALIGDERVGPVAGQTVLVRGEAEGIRTRVGRGEGEIRYVIPRPGSRTTILGGTRGVGVWDTKVCNETTVKILEGCKGLAPELLGANGEFEVLSSQVGLRPSRKGGPRVEVQVLEGGEVIVHSYGHSGAGYQNSVGSANKVLRLLQELEQREGSPAKL